MIYRSFADANKIGATGLRGRSWPDLDMLPFGRLTDAGDHSYHIKLCGTPFLAMHICSNSMRIGD